MNVDPQRKDVKKGPILVAILLGGFVAILNQTSMNVALPPVMNDFGIAANTAQWLTTAYMLVNGILIPITAFLMERFTTRKLFITAMTLFSIGTLISGLSPTFAMLIFGRVIQASGAGIMMPLMMNVVLSLFPPEKRGAAMGLVGVALVFGPAIGPTFSGWAIETYSWRVIFFSFLPIAILDIIIAAIWLKNVTRLSYPKIDLLAVFLSTVGFGGILYGFSEAGNDGWGSMTVQISLVLGMIGLALFVWRELTVETPMLEFRVFKYGMFGLTTVINGVVTMALFSAMVLVPIYVQNVRGFTALESGLLMLPGALIMGVMNPIVGKVFDKIGARWIVVTGLVITAITSWQFSFLTNSTTYSYIMVLYAMRLFGMSMLMMPIMTAGLNSLPSRLNSHGTAMTNTTRQVAGSIGIAFLVTVMSNRTDTHFADYSNELTSANPGFMAQLQDLGQKLTASAGLSPQVGQESAIQMIYGLVMKQSVIDGLNDAFLVATFITLVALFLAFFLRKTTPPDEN
ncbi:DHA2 family efflux MFS transporter permease subunit [Aquibacillus sp. 3ASR75-11]|uniref:DHA2 family efflux MFS transporter permease subunit n=2 Tax=Terrihalobacillus insolitus TaxID=2950438 RepID=A0A9X3WV31_9BACI|nr:DHA2 family efflux MFS transporter permease subunit [Terrihalobacillus insolitus]MDC3413519.1 DHA2 family efflux MFS transporter permease subunit [Terrihalobacillus insolitus]MDC3426195.1 DHA2 family efflux MFS transporter permease subunit [Terrihalobacillus insolitus]